jgi:L-ascorbate metabolism protein UlaG (beta-lactamase superfamily)
MRVEWFGQSAFSLTGEDAKAFIDPFTDMSGMARERGMKWEYPAIEQDGVDLLLVTHEHVDHNGVEAISGEPATLRATAGRHESPIGEVLGIASEHDESAGTERGPNTIFAFDLDGIRVAHLGDFGQRELRPEQAAALEGVDLLFLPVGGGPTIGGSAAREIVEALRPRWVVPMHYRTPRIGFLDTEEEFLAGMSTVERLSESGFDPTRLPNGEGATAVVPAAP